MDQTTDPTVGLTETEKYLNHGTGISSDSESDTEEVAQDALLGGIRTGLNTITRTARKALSNCKNKTELDDAAKTIENSSLKLLKLERSFLKTASIVSAVIEDLVPDFDEDESIQPCYIGDSNNDTNQNHQSCDCCDIAAAGDASSHSNSTPAVFRISDKNLTSVRNFKDKLSKEFHKRLSSYEDSLTESLLKNDKKFVALLDQIKLGRKEAEDSMKTIQPVPLPEVEELGQSESFYKMSFSKQNSHFLAQLPYTEKELGNYEYKSDNEDKDMDDTVLPSIDPITRNPIEYPVRNKFCNHVFDKDSICDYISLNPMATCPVYMCRNPRPLQVTHFEFDSVLTSHVRRKNQLELK